MQHRDVSRRAMLLSGAAWIAAPLNSYGATPAQQPGQGPGERYAVLSLIGDKLTMVGYNPTTGSHLDQNDHSVVPVSEPTIDNNALLAVDAAIRRVQPSATTTLLSARDPRLYSFDEQALDNPGAEQQAFISTIGQLALASRSTRLVLVSKHRAEARFMLAHTITGTGYIAGLGFYIDGIKRLRMAKDGESGAGYLAPYAYLNFSLIDLQAMTVLRREIETRSRVVPAAASKDFAAPWELLTAVQKSETLQILVRRAAQDAVPRLLAG